VRQARRDRIASALRSRGYYDSRVTATVADQPVEEAAALDAIERSPMPTRSLSSSTSRPVRSIA
jgi:hypothetical protein